MNNSYLVSKVLNYYQSDWLSMVLVEKYPMYHVDRVEILTDGIIGLRGCLYRYFKSIFELGGVIILGNTSYHSVDSMNLRIQTQDPLYFRMIEGDPKNGCQLREMEMHVVECTITLKK